MSDADKLFGSVTFWYPKGVFSTYSTGYFATQNWSVVTSWLKIISSLGIEAQKW